MSAKKIAPTTKAKPAAVELKVEKPGLTDRELTVLGALKASGKTPMTRADLSAKTGIARGWSKMLGAATKDGLGARGKASLEGRGLIASSKAEGSLTLTYTLTAAGAKALAAAQ